MATKPSVTASWATNVVNEPIEIGGNTILVTYEEQDVLFPDKVLPVEPERPPLLTVEQWRIKNYSLLRSCAYPSTENQLAMQYDDQANGTAFWIDKQNEIKEKYPKE